MTGKKGKRVTENPPSRGEILYFTDSSAILRMLRIESRKFNEFMGSWVSEVKVNGDMENEWVWLIGNCNPADLSTRPTATP